MKSILDLLREEDNVVRGIEQLKRYKRHYELTVKVAIETNIEYERRDDDIREYSELVATCDKALVSAYQDLIRIRKQIRVAIMGRLDT